MADGELDTLRVLLGGGSSDDGGAALPDEVVKTQLLDLADAPAPPVDLARGKAGARHPRHRHGGDELILVLEGVLRDERGAYGPGALCRSRSGDVHTEEVVEDCLCYVVYYGELQMLEEA